MKIKTALISNLGNGHQLQFGVEEEFSIEALTEISDQLVDIAKREVARVNIASVEMKIETIRSRIKGQREMMELIEASIEASKQNTRVNGRGTVFTIDKDTLNKQAAQKHNAEMELKKLEVDLELGELELQLTKKDAGVK